MHGGRSVGRSVEEDEESFPPSPPGKKRRQPPRGKKGAEGSNFLAAQGEEEKVYRLPADSPPTPPASAPLKLP